MFDFYTIVTICAILLLIISLVTIGVIITQSSSTASFPSFQTNCPDYWTSSIDGKTCTAPSSGINIGSPTVGPTYKPTDLCTSFNWAHKNNIIWDSVSNTNNCKISS